MTPATTRTHKGGDLLTGFSSEKVAEFTRTVSFSRVTKIACIVFSKDYLDFIGLENIVDIVRRSTITCYLDCFFDLGGVVEWLARVPKLRSIPEIRSG